MVPSTIRRSPPWSVTFLISMVAMLFLHAPDHTGDCAGGGDVQVQGGVGSGQELSVSQVNGWVGLGSGQEWGLDDDGAGSTGVLEFQGGGGAGGEDESHEADLLAAGGSPEDGGGACGDGDGVYNLEDVGHPFHVAGGGADELVGEADDFESVRVVACYGRPTAVSVPQYLEPGPCGGAHGV